MAYYYKVIRMSILTLLMLSTGKVFSQNKKIDSLNQVVANTCVDSVKVSSTIQISREWHRLPNHDTKDIDIASEAVDLALISGDTVYYSRALDNLGLLYRFHQH